MHRGQLSAADIITTYADLHDRVVRDLHVCGVALTALMPDGNALDSATVAELARLRDVLNGAIRDVQTTAFAVRQQLHSQAAADDGQRRYLVRIEDEAVIAYAVGNGHDFRRIYDDTMWAYESDGTLLKERSATPIARRSGIVYYDPVRDIPLYYLTP